MSSHKRDGVRARIGLRCRAPELCSGTIVGSALPIGTNSAKWHKLSRSDLATLPIEIVCWWQSGDWCPAARCGGADVCVCGGQKGNERCQRLRIVGHIQAVRQRQ